MSSRASGDKPDKQVALCGNAVVPRVSGDKPVKRQKKVLLHQCSPRQRG
ncbi:hypothetical protein PEC301653_01490 [Pectobacterium carotovorum subsp. carotovorum]|nr:hypothetical protein PEC301653_01490 [Pectobacterium carotovorum subsp. carotovorum]